MNININREAREGLGVYIVAVYPTRGRDSLKNNIWRPLDDCEMASCGDD